MFTASRFLLSSAIATVLVTGIQFAASARSALVCGQELGSAVNVRKTPSVSDNVIGTAKVGDRVDILNDRIGRRDFAVVSSAGFSRSSRLGFGRLCES